MTCQRHGKVDPENEKNQISFRNVLELRNCKLKTVQFNLLGLWMFNRALCNGSRHLAGAHLPAAAVFGTQHATKSTAAHGGNELVVVKDLGSRLWSCWWVSLLVKRLTNWRTNVLEDQCFGNDFKLEENWQWANGHLAQVLLNFVQGLLAGLRV